MKKLLVISLIISILCSTITSCQLLTDINGQSEDDNQFHLVYNRSFDEGWDIKNGMKLVDHGSTGSTTFNIEYEETEDFSYNYFMRLELNSTDNDYVELNAGGRGYLGAVFEMDVKSDDVCNFANIVAFSTKENKKGEKSDYKLLTVENNRVYLMRDLFPDAEPAFELTNEWTKIRLVFDYTYEHEPILDTDSASEQSRKSKVNQNYIRLYLYYSDPATPDEMTLFSGAPIILEAKGGKGISSIRFQSTNEDHKEDFGTGICFDNIKFYDGVTAPIDITPDMGYGTEVNSSTPKTITIIGGNTSASSTR